MDGETPKTTICIFSANEDMETMRNFEQVTYCVHNFVSNMPVCSVYNKQKKNNYMMRIMARVLKFYVEIQFLVQYILNLIAYLSLFLLSSHRLITTSLSAGVREAHASLQIP